MTHLWPRLGPASQSELLGQLRSTHPTDLRANASVEPHPDTIWYPTGARVPTAVIQAVAAAVRDVADSFGWPDLTPNEVARRSFDQRIAGLLHSQMDIVPADAAHPDVWANLTLVVIPDVARWRYPDHHNERYVGRTDRNTFGRLWWRAHRLGAGEADPPTRLVEDQVVAILERPSLGGRQRVARALASSVLDHPANSQDLMREAAILLRRQLAVIETSLLDDASLRTLADQAVAAAATSDRLRR